jgi:hypothetical protein
LEYKVSAVRIFLAVFLVNAIGFALKYFELDTFIILLGFRFHLSAIFPLLIVINATHLSLIKDSFLHPPFVKVGRVILTFFFTSLLFLLVLYLTKKIEIGDPEYFYEFGLSSIVDYPIYLVWNSINLICLFFFFLLINKSFKNSFLVILALAILIFAYEFIPLRKMIFDYESIAAFVILSFVLSITIRFFNNIYLFVVLIFSIIWFSLLAFGTTSSLLVNLFFAARYSGWEGFFIADKNFSGFLIPVTYLLILLSLITLSLFRKRKST